MTHFERSLDGSRVLPHLLSRRTLLGALGAGAALTYGLPARGQDSSPVSEATPVAGSPVAGTPIATPVEAAGPEMIGKLVVVRDQRPEYLEDPERSGEITMVRVGKSNADYNPASFAQDFQIPASYLEPLVWIDGVTMEVRPWLATEWSWNDERTVIEYQLRDDVRWHDGERFTARDAAFSFTVYRDDIYSNAYNLFVNMASAEAVDTFVLRVTLNRPDGNWIRNASSQLIFQREQYGAYWDARPVGQRTLDGFDWAASTPVGTGTWRITSYRDSRVIFERNAEHWATRPWSNELRVDFVGSEDEQIQRWLEGSADVAWPIPPARLTEAGERAGTVYAAETTRTMFAAFNFSNPARTDPGLLQDIRVRRALSFGIDRRRYADTLFAGFFRPDVPGTILQPTFLLDGLTNPAYDPEQCRALLEEAGFTVSRNDGLFRYPDGTALKLDVIFRRGDDPMLEPVLNSIAEDLRAAGVLLEVRPLSAERFDQIWIAEHTFDMIAFSYSLYPGFTDFDLYGSDWDIRTNIQGFNPGGYRNEAVNRALERALVAETEEDLRSALHAVQRHVNDEDLFALWLGSPLEAVVVKEDIAGFQPNKVWQGMETARLWRD